MVKGESCFFPFDTSKALIGACVFIFYLIFSNITPQKELKIN